MKYKTNIEITSDASDKDEAMEIVGDYLSGNIVSGIDMKCATKPVRFYNNTAAKAAVVTILVMIGFLSGARAKPQHSLSMSMCQMAAVTPPLKTANSDKDEMRFKNEWENKKTTETINFIKQ